jgi:hypothetical protein
MLVTLPATMAIAGILYLGISLALGA